MNDKAMRAEAVAVANGKILAVGKRSEVMKRARRRSSLT
jgi:predicted amidohydrolase YtcJ